MHRKSAIAAMAAALMLPMSAMAHHSYAMFDHARELELKDATVKAWQWTSPHAWLFVVAPTGAGDPEKYAIECPNPGLLRRAGYGIGTFKPGDKVTVYISPLKSGEKGGALLAVILPDGRMLGQRLQAGDKASVS